MAAVMPGDIITEPDKKIVYNAPFSEKNAYNIRLTNNGAHRIGWAIKTTNMARLQVDPPCGVLDPKESVMMTVACEPMDFDSENTGNDRISFDGPTPPKEPPSSSAANGSKATA
eukprot:979685_1